MSTQDDLTRDAQGLNDAAAVAEYFGAIAEGNGEADAAAANRADAVTLRRWADLFVSVAAGTASA